MMIGSLSFCHGNLCGDEQTFSTLHVRLSFTLDPQGHNYVHKPIFSFFSSSLRISSRFPTSRLLFSFNYLFSNKAAITFTERKENSQFPIKHDLSKSHSKGADRQIKPPASSHFWHSTASYTIIKLDHYSNQEYSCVVQKGCEGKYYCSK
ncbi:hypothetical protein OIU77_028560 [Salix suchowensis]|uniref:Uncharacterized protein n=1 Tax=Salix suchowensis TaxID=1278906 RepID=A0ABQ9BHU5_9ROSI|nr:hypothetical protein OIU77_028560 [Salix suchowensis]